MWWIQGLARTQPCCISVAETFRNEPLKHNQGDPYNIRLLMRANHRVMDHCPSSSKECLIWACYLAACMSLLAYTTTRHNSKQLVNKLKTNQRAVTSRPTDVPQVNSAVSDVFFILYSPRLTLSPRWVSAGFYNIPPTHLKMDKIPFWSADGKTHH